MLAFLRELETDASVLRQMRRQDSKGGGACINEAHHLSND